MGRDLNQESHVGFRKVRPVKSIKPHPLKNNRRSADACPAKRGTSAASSQASGEASMNSTQLKTLVAVRFATGDDVNKALDVLFDDPALRNVPWDSPDGYELHIPKYAEPLLRNRGLDYKLRLLSDSV
jgi:hypothetical protein